MKLVLQEILISLAWFGPTFTISCSANGLYACETAMGPCYGYAGMDPKVFTVTGPHVCSQEEAVESSCRAAISFLEAEKSICLVDLNYNHRSHGELYIVEAKEAMQFASFMSSKVCVQWQTMVDGISTCAEYCQKTLAEHPQEEQDSCLYRIKCNTTQAVSDLHAVCLADLQCAKARLKNLGALMVE
jgi:hypothetical protein